MSGGEKRSFLRLNLLLGSAFFAFALLVWLLASRNAAWGEALRGLCLRMQNGVSALFGHTRAPVCQALIAAAPALALAALIFKVARRRLRGLAHWLGGMFCAGGAVALSFVLLYGVQYTAPPLAGELGIEAGQYSAEQLAELTELLAGEASSLARQVERDDGGLCDFGSFDDVARRVDLAFEKLGSSYSFFNRENALPKQMGFLSTAMSYLNISGVYFPFTGEACVSGDTVESHIPFCIAHELSHSMGVGPEAEANFSAYLACYGSGDTDLEYSAALNAYVYAVNALYREDPYRASEISDTLSEECRFDLEVLNSHWDKYETPLRDVGDAVNDTYIKATGQPSGVHSYGQVVDLLIAYRIGLGE